VAAATFYYDPTSPYAWMAAERIGELIPDADWQAVYGLGLVKANGRTPWVFTDERESRLREIEERAARYGLPPIRWPGSLGERIVDVARAARVARRHGRERDFALAVARARFTEGRDPSRPDELRALASQAGLDGDELLAEIADDAVKEEVRAANQEALDRGALGIPTTIVGDEVFWGDDRLDDAAAAARD
jgi:2-hydroxychromene-2-carboxylate isomerase